jgi:hypothetical protein
MADRENVSFMYLKDFKIEWFIMGFLNRVLFLLYVDVSVWKVLESNYQHFEKQAVSLYYFKI